MTGSRVDADKAHLFCCFREQTPNCGFRRKANGCAFGKVPWCGESCCPVLFVSIADSAEILSCLNYPLTSAGSFCGKATSDASRTTTQEAASA